MIGSDYIRVLFIADVIGNPGIEKLTSMLSAFQKKYGVHLTIANAENAASGKGLTPHIAQTLFNLGIDVLTSGNHIWNREKIFPFLDNHPYLLRPLNYPPGCPGHGSCIIKITTGHSIGVFNLQGRSFLYPIDCPFRSADKELEAFREKGINITILDFHAEATAEKVALAWYLDGRVSAILGTHTHVQTADERILPKGTAYITDVGMTGPPDSVIGMDPQSAILRFTTQLPVPYRIAENPAQFDAVIVDIDPKTGKAFQIHRFHEM